MLNDLTQDTGWRSAKRGRKPRAGPIDPSRDFRRVPFGYGSPLLDPRFNPRAVPCWPTMLTREQCGYPKEMK